MAANDKLWNGLKWRNIGPFRGGRVIAVAGHADDRNTYYFGSTGGGVWKSDDAGVYWRNISDGYFKRASVGAIAVAEADPNVIYVGMGETTIRGNVSHGDGVYKSEDGGKSWRHLGLEATRNIAKVRVDPRDPNIVFVAAFGHAHGANRERGVYRSLDGGENWELVLHRSKDAGASDLSIDPNNPRIIYAGFWEARRGPHYLSSGGPGSGLFRSTDGGTTWVELTDKPGMPKGIKGKVCVAVSPAQQGRVWAMVENADGGLFRSDDGGESWERVNEDRNLRQRAWYYSHVIADPNDANTVYVLNVAAHRSVDGGKTFQAMPVPHGDTHDLWIDPNDSDRMILGDDGGGTVTQNGGRSWTPQYSQPTSEFYHVTTDGKIPYRVYGSQQDNTSLSLPSRSNWPAITRAEWHEIGGGEAGYIAVRPDDPNIVFAGEYQGYMTRYDHRTNQARSISVWPEEYSGSGANAYRYRFQWTYPIILSPHDPKVLFCGGNHVFRTTDEGMSWEAISPDLTRNDPKTHEASGGPITKDNTGAETYGTVFTFAESPVKAGVFWAGSDDGLVHVSKDGGTKWAKVTPSGLPDWALMSFVEASPFDAGTAYLAANRYKLDDFKPYLFRTTDYGKTWTKITTGIPDGDFCRVIRADPKQKGLLFAGTETGIYVSFNDGAKWERLGGNFPVVPVHDLVIHADDLVVGTHGRAFWVLDDITPFRQVAAGKGPKSGAHLFAPRTTYRLGTMPGFSWPPVKGTNYQFSNTQVPAFNYEKTPDGEVITTWLDAGENPPNGAVISFVLPDPMPEKVSLTFLDSDGNELRTFTTKPKKDEKADKGDTFPPKTDEADDDDATWIFARPGLNRFTWDLRLPEATKITAKGGDKPDRSGPRVPPGDYAVRLEVDGKKSTEQFTLLADPRVSVTAKEFAAQYALLKKIHAKHDELNVAVNQIRTLREQATDWAKRVDGKPGGEKVVKAAKDLVDRLDKVEDGLLQRKIQSGQDSLNFPVKLNAKLSALAWMVGGSDGAPPKQHGEHYADLAKQVDALLADLGKITSKQVPAFNKVVSESGISALDA